MRPRIRCSIATALASPRKRPSTQFRPFRVYRTGKEERLRWPLDIKVVSNRASVRPSSLLDKGNSSIIIVYTSLVPANNNLNRTAHVLPQDRELCACTTLRELARRTTAIYDDAFEPLGMKVTQYGILARLDRLVHCNLGELANACGLDITSLSRALRPLVANGWIETGRGKDDRTKRYELTTRGKQVLRKGFALWNKAQRRLHEVIAPERIRTLRSLSESLKDSQ